MKDLLPLMRISVHPGIFTKDATKSQDEELIVMKLRFVLASGQPYRARYFAVDEREKFRKREMEIDRADLPGKLKEVRGR